MVATFFMMIVMMNLLIAIISDTFERVMSEIEASQYQQQCDLVLEMEFMFVFFNWANNEPMQLIIKGDYLEDKDKVWRSRMQATTDKVEQQLTKNMKDL